MKKAKSVGLGIILAAISIVSLIPFWLMFSMSTYKSEMIFQNNPMIPSDFFLENLKTIFQSNFVQSYLNSFLISAAAMILSVIICAMAGYAMGEYILAHDLGTSGNKATLFSTDGVLCKSCTYAYGLYRDNPLILYGQNRTGKNGGRLYVIPQKNFWKFAK